MPGDMRILIVAPQTDDLKVLPELSAIASGNRPVILQGAHVSRQALEQALASKQFDFIHFMLHGDHGLLMLSDGPITGEALARACHAQKELRVIFVNACNSLGTATVLHNALHVPVIAHEAEISDSAAIMFARECYAALACGIPLDKAFYSARETTLRLHSGAVAPQIIDGDMATLQLIGHNTEQMAAMSVDMRRMDERMERIEEGTEIMGKRVDERMDRFEERLQSPTRDWPVILLLVLILASHVVQWLPLLVR